MIARDVDAGFGTGPVRVEWAEGDGWDKVEFRAIVENGRPVSVEARLLGQQPWFPIEDTHGFSEIWAAGERALQEAQAKWLKYKGN